MYIVGHTYLYMNNVNKLDQNIKIFWVFFLET